MFCHAIVFSIIYSEAYFHNTLAMKDLGQITVTGLGLLGSSITLRILCSLPGVKVVGYTHRLSARVKARRQGKDTEK